MRRNNGIEDSFELERTALGDDLFEAFVTGKGSAAVDEINDQLLDRLDQIDVQDDLITALRATLVAECDKPVADRGAFSYELLKSVVEGACENIAQRCIDEDDIKNLRHDLDV